MRAPVRRPRRRVAARRRRRPASTSPPRASSWPTASGSRYDRLILATGARAAALARRRRSGSTACTRCASLDDALALRAALRAGPRLAIVGAGFIGCEVAATARKLGLDVTLIDVAPQPMPALGPERRRALRRAAPRARRRPAARRRRRRASRARGRLEAVRARRRHARRRRRRRRRARRDPQHRLARRAPGSARSPASCATRRSPRATPSTSSRAGDVAAWPHPLADGGLIRDRALDERRRAGRARRPQRCSPRPPSATRTRRSPYFWSDQYDVKIQSVGLPAPRRARDRARAAPDGDRFVLGGERDGRLVAAIAFNAAAAAAVLPPPARDDAAARRRRRRRARRREGARRRGGRAMTALVAQHGDWGPPGAARRVARRARHPVRRCTAPTSASRCPTLARLRRSSPRSARTATRTTPTTPPVAAELVLLRDGDRRATSPCSASASAARCSPPRSAATVETRAAARARLARRSRPTTPSAIPAGPWLRVALRPLHASRPARPRSRAPAPRRRRSATAATSASSSTPRAPSRSSRAGRASDAERLAALGHRRRRALIAATRGRSAPPRATRRSPVRRLPGRPRARPSRDRGRCEGGTDGAPARAVGRVASRRCACSTPTCTASRAARTCRSIEFDRVDRARPRVLRGRDGTDLRHTPVARRRGSATRTWSPGPTSRR